VDRFGGSFRPRGFGSRALRGCFEAAFLYSIHRLSSRLSTSLSLSPSLSLSLDSLAAGFLLPSSLSSSSLGFLRFFLSSVEVAAENRVKANMYG
jgi:hypothetical protein